MVETANKTTAIVKNGPENAMYFENAVFTTRSNGASEILDKDFIMNNFVSITKKEDYDWFDIIPQLKKFVQEYLETEKPIVVVKDKLSDEEESEVVTKIKQLLEDHVKPAVEMDGGNIAFKSFDNGIVTLIMQGACSGCPSSSATSTSNLCSW